MILTDCSDFIRTLFIYGCTVVNIIIIVIINSQMTFYPSQLPQGGVAVIGDVDLMRKEEKLLLSTTLQNRAAIIGKKKTEVSLLIRRYIALG